MNFFYYIFHFIYYPCVGLTIISDYQYSYTNITIMKYIFSLFVFLNASYIQYNIHLTLEKQNPIEQNEIKPIPYGYWIFNYFSCPNSIIEIIIYLSFFLTSHRTSAMASLLVWVFTNQSLSALLNHRWFCRYYKDSYPTKRRALIPFIL
ncbi:unnamed protein product [Adineta steineri]|uniref:Polyprenal reductase n=1 Tax=Adineta steineri TaxID=433720 RepID=A0A815AS46_9BILA|nr:unnamed protein product [Adineta steineri]